MLFADRYLYQVDDPAAATPPAPVEPPAASPEAPADPPPGDAPWATDLTALFPDEAARGVVDTYLRDKWQPRMTQLEQELATAKPGGQMYADFLEDPLGTYQSIGEQMFGSEFATQQQAIFAAEAAPPTAAEAAAAQLAAPPAAPPPLDPRVEAMLADHTNQQQQELYRTNLDRLKGDDPEKPLLNEELFHPFVVAAEGDFDQAFTAYKAWEAQVQAQYGPPAEGDPPPAAAPGTLGGGEAAGTVAPPVEQKYASLDDALRDTMAEMRAAREPAPTTVGSV